MTSHVELNPDADVLGLSLGMKAMRLALTQKTHKIGTVRIPTNSDTDIIIGDGAHDGANRVDNDGNQLPLVDTSAIDKAAQDARKAADDAAKKADSAGAKADQVRADLQSEVDKVSAKADDLGRTGDQLAAQITDIKGTVNGQATKLKEFDQRLEGEITRGDTTVKSVTELKQTVSGIGSKVEQTTRTADAALSKASQVEQTAAGIKTTLSEDYTSTKDADAKYSSKSELEQTAKGIRGDLSSVSQTASGALDKANALEVTASGLNGRISETASRLDSTITTVNQVRSTADTNSKTISQTASLVDAALAGDNLVTDGGFESTAYWAGLKKPWRLSSGALYHGRHVLVGDPATGDVRCPLVHARGDASKAVALTVTKGRTYRLEGRCAWYGGIPDGVKLDLEKLRLGKASDGSHLVSAQAGRSTDWTYAGVDWRCPDDGSVTSVVLEIMHQSSSGTIMWDDVSFRDVTDAVDTVNRVSSVEQSLTGFKATVAKTYQDKAGMGAYATQSQLQQTAAGIRSEVGEKYTTKEDLDGLTIGGTNLLVNSDFSQGTANWVLELQNNGLGTVSADKLSGCDFASTMCTINVAKATTGMCRIYQLRTPNPMRTDTVDTVSFWAKASGKTSLLVGRMDDQHWIGIGTKWKRYTLTVQKWGNPNAFCIAVGANFTGTVKVTKLMWEHASKPSAWSPAPEELQPAGDYSTRSYVQQTAKSVALGVVQDYKGADGSGLATKSDISVEHSKIVSEVSGTYATKEGVTAEISSSITQNNASLDVKFATKAEDKDSHDKANLAYSQAKDAQSRVGTLETCISMTEAGVRAGRQSDGAFTGVSALVNADGSFDLLDADGNLLTRINRHRFQVTGDDGVGSGYVSLSQKGVDISVQPTANESVTYHIQLGNGGIGITAPDGSHINCSAKTGLDIETVKYGKLSIGSGGLQFTNDRGWGLALSASGWSLKWAGNHKLATGPTAGKLYIDGHEIVTK